MPSAVDILVGTATGIELVENEHIQKSVKWIGKKTVQGIRRLAKPIRKPRPKPRTKK